MKLDFRKLLKPTKEELQEQYDQINEILKEQYEKLGKCCRTCKHCIYVQESVYCDYNFCELHNAVRFAFGNGAEKHKCKDYEFRGYLEIKEKD